MVTDYTTAARRNRELLKAQRSADQYLQSSIRTIEGAGIRGTQARPFNMELGVQEFRSWVYAAVMLNANAVASLPLRLFVNVPEGQRLRHYKTRKASPRQKQYLRGETHGTYGMVGPNKYVSRKIIEFGDDFEEVVSDHPVLDLIRTVNPWFNGFDLLQLIVIYLELTGNSYIHPVIGPLGVPDELWPMPSQWVWVKPDRDQFIEGYLYGRDMATQTEFDIDEVIHFRTANPGRDGLFYGRGKVEAGWGVVQLNTSNHDMDLSFANNHARPDYLAIVNQTTPDSLDRFEQKVEQKLRGNKGSGKFLTLGGNVTLQPLNFPPKDLTGRDDTIEEIAAIIGVPVSMLKANDPNLASAKSGYAQWRETSVLPIATLIEQKLNERLLPLFVQLLFNQCARRSTATSLQNP
jgi:HK97 family phage portal protein